MPALSDLSYDAWMEHSFSHEVRVHGNPWFFDEDPPWWDPAPVVAVAYLTRLFASPEAPLTFFSDEQIAQGLTYLVSTSASGDNGWLYSRTVPTDARLRCIEAIDEFFARLFALRCAPALGHLSEPGAEARLNMVCYMWWDEFPCLALPDDPDFGLLHGAAVGVMRRILRLEFDCLPGSCSPRTRTLGAAASGLSRARSRRVSRYSCRGSRGADCLCPRGPLRLCAVRPMAVLDRTPSGYRIH